jgi:signal transduction histidine kinase
MSEILASDEAQPTLRPRPLERAHGLGRQTALGGAVIGLALVVSALLAGMSIRDSAQARGDLLSHVDPAILQVQHIDDAVRAQLSAVHEYAATADPARKADFDRAVEAETAAADSATRLLRGAPRSASALTALSGIAAATAAWRRDFAGPVLARQGRTDLNASLVRMGDRRSDAVQSALAAAHSRLDALHRSSMRRFRTLVAHVYRTLTACGIVLIIGAVVLTMLVRNTLLRPVTELTARIRRVGEGDLDHPLDVTGPAEIAELSAHVDAMRDHILREWRNATDAQIRLGEQTAELRRSNAELEQFAYVASHDLQEPLRNIARFCELLERRYSDVLDERGRRYIEYAVDGARRMQALIDDLLEFSRVERTGREMTTVDCDDLLRRALDDLGLALSESDAGITCDPLPEVIGDPILLTHLFQNLIGNSIKFRGESAPRVHVEARRESGMWEFSCTDNGIGIDSSQAGRVFLIFQRLHPKDDYSGTGIGLALCRKIVEYHGGRIWLDTEHSGPGTVIRWTLPARDRAPA